MSLLPDQFPSCGQHCHLLSSTQILSQTRTIISLLLNYRLNLYFLQNYFYSRNQINCGCIIIPSNFLLNSSGNCPSCLVMGCDCLSSADLSLTMLAPNADTTEQLPGLRVRLWPSWGLTKTTQIHNSPPGLWSPGTLRALPSVVSIWSSTSQRMN